MRPRSEVLDRNRPAQKVLGAGRFSALLDGQWCGERVVRSEEALARLDRVPAPAGRSVVRVFLESDEPVKAVSIDDLPVRGAPRMCLQLIDDLAALAEPGEPVPKDGGRGSSKQCQHHALGSEGRLVTNRVSGEQRDGSIDEVAVGNRVGWTIAPIEFGKRVQLNSATEDIGVEGQGFPSGAAEMEVRRRVGHERHAIHDERGIPPCAAKAPHASE